MEEMTVNPKHVNLPDNENESKVIAGLESTEKSFKLNLSLILNIREVGSVSSGQVRPKAIKLSLKDKPIFPKISPNPQSYKETDSIISGAATAKTPTKNTQMQSATDLKKYTSQHFLIFRRHS